MVNKLRIIILIVLMFILSSCDDIKNLDNNFNTWVTSTWITIENDVLFEEENTTNSNQNERIQSENNDNIIKEKTQLEKEEIDEYNFQQLEIVKSTLDKLQKDSYILRNYIDFNEKFEKKLEPIDNCYYLSTNNWNYPYIFWFKLKSEKYINQYSTWIISYPEYDIPVNLLCHWMCDIWKECSWCIDKNYDDFKDIIWKSCWWSISWYIYEDINKNNTWDIWEQWIEWFPVKLWLNIVLTDKDWYYSYGNLNDWEYNIEFTRILEWYTTTDNTIRKIKIKKWENINNIHFWIFKEQ